jgi:hypothetical protein
LVFVRAGVVVGGSSAVVGLAAVFSGGARDWPLDSLGTYDQSLTFYLQRTVTLVGYRGELDYGLRKEPGAEIADVAEFLRRWSSQSRAFAVMEKSMFEDLKSRGVPMRLVATDVNRVMVARQ